MFLAAERQALEAFLPGFDAELADLGPARTEAPDSDVVELFRKAGGGNLLIPAELGGAGASALAATRVQRALGSRSPSLAVGGTMHHYKVAWLARQVQGSAKLGLIRQVAAQRWLVASCGAESGVGLFNPGIEVRAVPGGLSISGTKQPCSLVWSMGLLSMLVRAPEDSPFAGDLVNVLVPAAEPGITRGKLWANPVLAGAQTGQVRLTDVVVPHEWTVRLGPPGASAALTTSALVWFELLITAAYLGAASGCVEQVLHKGRGRPEDRSAVAGALEAVMAALEGVAAGIDRGETDDAALSRSLFVRYAAQRAIAEATDRSLDLLGGAAFASGPGGLHMLGATRALAFHPPAEVAMREPLAHYLTDGELTLP